MLGQSNMLGEGHIGNLSGNLSDPVQKNDLARAVAIEGKYPYLYDKTTKNWTTSKTVRNVFVLGSGGPNGKYGSRVMTDEWMSGPNHRNSIGPELGIGGMLETANPTTPYLMLKSCIGDRALGWDLLSPGTKRSSYTDSAGAVWTYAGYHDSPEKWIANKTQPPPIGWYAGEQYDGDIFRANGVLSNLSTFYPSTPPQKCYEVAGCESSHFRSCMRPPLLPLRPPHASDPFLTEVSKVPCAEFAAQSSGGRATRTRVTWASPPTTNRTWSR